ncbi:MAG: hypothetical protein Q4F79_04440 [Eubacteriales bacterium]|nr:hypothetical protein [Eubacteriales bacterium]
MKVNIVYGTEENKVKALRVVARLRKQKQGFNCPCMCYDSSIIREGGEVWMNWDTLKFRFYEEDGYLLGQVNFCNLSVCPICGKYLPTNSRDKLTNGMKKI